MSTIEDAREQAREALITISKRMSVSRLGELTMREMDADVLALRAVDATIRALLDATEPPVIQCADSALVADTDAKIADENAELLERLAVERPEPRPFTEEELDVMAQRFQEVSRVGIIYTGKREIVAGLRAALEAAEGVRR